MQALYLKKGRLYYSTNYPKPEPKRGEALIRVVMGGICATDIELIRGYKGGFSGVLGHEFVGVVDAVADEADQDWVGRRVVSTINILPEAHPRKTAQEIELLAKHHPDRVAIGIFGRDGAFADFVALPVQNLWEVPDNLTAEEAVFAEPLAAALEILEQVDIHADMRIGVVGPGRLGMLCGAVLAQNGAEVTMLGRRPESLGLAEQWELSIGMVSETADHSYDLVVDTTGNGEGFAQALRLVRPRGTIVLKSTFHDEATINYSQVVVNEITVVGSRCGPFAPALRLLAEKTIDVSSMVDALYPFQSGHEALIHAGKSGVRKVLLYP